MKEMSWSIVLHHTRQQVLGSKPTGPSANQGRIRPIINLTHEGDVMVNSAAPY
jgi:hypothetical protein